MYAESSKDILYLVISFSVLLLSVFLCWILYYAMRLLRNANQIIEEFRMRLQGVTEAIQYIRGKVEHMSGLLSLATSGVGGLVKNVVTSKAKAWMERSSGKATNAAKDAVEKAVEATAKKMKKVAKNIKK